MKYIYITGLEHSGTTLLADLVGHSEGAVAIGEVAQFFSAEHMRGYLLKWGQYPDVRLCSCGADWQDCEFWSRYYHLSGLESDAPIAEEYKVFLESLQDEGEEKVFVDSSKVLAPLTEVRKNWGDPGGPDDALFVLFSIKDARSFVSSVLRKQERRSFYDVLKSFNWWNGVNRNILDYLRRSGIDYKIILYEKLCFDTKTTIESINNELRLDNAEPPHDVTHNQSHIVLGNKDYISRNRNAINYPASCINLGR